VNRQDEAWRNHINAYCQQALITDGMKPRQAAVRLKGMPSRQLHEMMHDRGINLAKTPAWQRRGVLVYKKTSEKEGFNPVTKEKVKAIRSSVVVDDDLPLFTAPEGQAFLEKLIGCP
jgi:tRNA(His) guanylyltransferase